MSTQGLVNVANQLAHRLDQSAKVRPLKFLIFNSNIKLKTQFLLLLQKARTLEDIVINLTTLHALSILTSLSKSS